MGPMIFQSVAVSRTQIAFVYAGDVWVVERQGGEARRLTTHPGTEMNPVFSPDGAWIAYTSVAGSDGVLYVVPSAGGEARRLTYHPKLDLAMGWSRDGKSVLFTSMREYDGVWRLYIIPAQGGFPVALPLPMAYSGSFSPDGARIAYVARANLFRTWRNYRGGDVTPIWIANLADSSIEEIPHSGADDFNPMWLGDKIYFISERNGTGNLCVYDLKTKKLSQLTRFEKYDVRAAAACADAIAFMQDGAIHLYDLRSGQTRLVEVRINGDFPETKPRKVKAERFIRAFAFAPAGNQVALGARGEILMLDVTSGEGRNLTQTSGVAERTPAWSHDGNSLAYFSDESGEYQLHIRSLSDGSLRKLAIESHPSFYSELTWSPDSQRLAFSDKRLSLWLADLRAGATKRIDSSTYPGQDAYQPAWSPNSRWLAYSRHLPNRVRAIFIHSIETGQNHQITEGNSEAEFPVFDQNGQYLYFAASDNVGPSKNWGMSGRLFEPLVNRRLHLVVLQKDALSPLLPGSVEGEGVKVNAGKIDFNDIGNRILQLPIPWRNYVAMAGGKSGALWLLERNLANSLAPDGQAQQTLYKFTLSTRKFGKMAEDVSHFALSADGAKLLVRAKGSVAIISADAPMKPGEGRINLAAMEIQVDPRAEWRQMFDEVWRIEREYFIDPNLHGQNLAALKEKFAAYLPNIVTRNDLTLLFREMLSHLSISHMSIGGGDAPAVSPENVGLLGANFEIEQGRYRITRIYRGDNSNPLLSGPLAQPGVNVKEGEFLLSVDGQEIKAEENIYHYFINKSGRPVKLKVGADAQGNGARLITVVPSPGENSLRRHDWAEANRRKVAQMSGGKLGYVYLPGFGLPAYYSFVREFFASADKQGMIIDQRFSPGGATADLFIEMLQRTPLSYYTFREG
jgi:tricorn protease